MYNMLLRKCADFQNFNIKTVAKAFNINTKLNVTLIFVHLITMLTSHVTVKL